jgi:hypothetical protein
MENWGNESTAEREQVPDWLVDFCQIWAADSSARYPQEFAEWQRLAQAANVPPFVTVLRMFRDTYGITPTTTVEEFKEKERKQTEADGGKMFLLKPQ